MEGLLQMEALLPTRRITMGEEGLGEELPSIFGKMTRSHTSGNLLFTRCFSCHQIQCSLVL